MNTNIYAYLNKPLTIDIFTKLIESSKDLAVIYSFKRGEDLYIGRTINLQARLKNHIISPFVDSKSNSCRILYETVRKYGWDQFTFNILEVIPDHEREGMASKEVDYIKKLQPALNIRYSQVNRPFFSESTREKLSEMATEMATGRPVSESTREKLSSIHGSPVLVNCITDKIEKTYNSYARLRAELKIHDSTVKKYMDSDNVYTSRSDNKQYKFYSVKK